MLQQCKCAGCCLKYQGTFQLSISLYPFFMVSGRRAGGSNSMVPTCISSKHCSSTLLLLLPCNAAAEGCSSGGLPQKSTRRLMKLTDDMI